MSEERHKSGHHEWVVADKKKDQSSQDLRLTLERQTETGDPGRRWESRAEG